MEERSDRDAVRFVRARHLPGVELVSVAYRDRAFPVHSHAEYVVGTVLGGAERLSVRGVDHIVAKGDVLRLHPGEPHANRCLGDEVLRYKVLYLPEAAIAAYLEGPLRFDGPAVSDAALSAVVAEAHGVLASDAAGRLEQESAMLVLAGALAGGGDAEPREEGGAAIRRARDWIDVHCTEAFGLGDAAAVAELSLFRFAHLFKQAVGLSPIAYRNQQRVHAARKLLLAGKPIAEAALEVGFADQSHLTRQFQRIVGVSPGKYVQQ